MNRAQRRHAAKHGLVETEHLTEEEFELKVRRKAEAIANARVARKMDQAIMETLENSMAAVVAVLHEEEGWGPKRVQRFMGQYNAIFDRVLAGEVDLDDLRKAALELGVNLNKNTAEINDHMALMEEEAND